MQKFNQIYQKHLINKQFVYTNQDGEQFCEPKGTYNSNLTKSIVQDFVHLGQSLPTKMSSVSTKIALDVNTLDDNLMQMIGDRTNNRRLTDFNFELSQTVFQNLYQVKNLYPEAYSNLILIRILYILKWVTYLTFQDELDHIDLTNVEDKETVNYFCETERKLLDLYLNTNLNGEEEEKCLAEIEKIDILIQLIIQNKVDEFLEKFA